jgi:hypothetical protein
MRISQPNIEPSDWDRFVHNIVEQHLQKRIEIAEREIGELRSRLNRVESLCEKASLGSACVPIHTFGREPFEPTGPISALVQPEEDGFVASLTDANLSSSGDTQYEAVENLKDLILMAFRGFENEDDETLGPAMLKQKRALFAVIRRKQ